MNCIREMIVYTQSDIDRDTESSMHFELLR